MELMLVFLNHWNDNKLHSTTESVHQRSERQRRTLEEDNKLRMGSASVVYDFVMRLW